MFFKRIRKLIRRTLGPKGKANAKAPRTQNKPDDKAPVKVARQLLALADKKVAEERSVAEHQKAFGADSCSNRAFLNIGAGGWSHPYWKNLDILQPKYKGNPPDIIHNLMEKGPIAIASDCLDGAYCSHVIEHVTDEADLVLFREIHRALRPGGVFRLVFPDVDVAFRAYAAGDKSLFLDNWPRKGNGRREAFPIVSVFVEYFAYHRLERNIRTRVPGHVTYAPEELEALLSEAMRAGDPTAFYDKMTHDLSEYYQQENPGCHRNWWNFAKAQRVLQAAGFQTVYPSAYLQSRFLPLRNESYFDQTHPHFSGYVEAIK